MSFRDRLSEAAFDHDALCERKGFKADADTDKARERYNRLRKLATPEEIASVEND